jgi:hypothetical protein
MALDGTISQERNWDMDPKLITKIDRYIQIFAWVTIILTIVYFTWQFFIR